MENNNEHFEVPGLECSIYKELEKPVVDFLNKSRKLLTLKKGESMYREGEQPTGVYCIHEGYVKGFKKGSDQKEQIIYLYKPGDLSGWHQIFCNSLFSTSACALDKVTATFIPKEAFLEAIENSRLSVILTRHICQDVIHLESKVLELSQKSVRERLATNIIMLFERYGVDNGVGPMIDVPLTREDYANLIGTNTETVIKLLSELRREGHIDFIERKVIIRNLSALRKFSDFYK